MTSPVSSAGHAYTPATTEVDRPDQMGKDTFLKLLVAQLRYQDPTKPADSSQMMSQTAVFSQVEKLEQLATQNAALLALQRTTSAGAMVGRTVTWTDSTGAAVTGTVSSVRLGSTAAEATAVVDGRTVELSRITEITS
ncbi:flagellar hook assembly protein FlgD [Geodermatophilus marinus]|uniref:flagellar hook assembly protein FlgD n=1 Tax=Geodermatophilus sp. LHW52908 TaxID=2303986 RepID=UPI000E3C1F3B|nr:flagellar hook capping FlgD N-terminal domain-containing protein [Geodermatophilus sp. LHW52908]RFU22868.1 flagellar hook capping protein [Geodermatophilus sp. LHW52908]